MQRGKNGGKPIQMQSRLPARCSVTILEVNERVNREQRDKKWACGLFVFHLRVVDYLEALALPERQIRGRP